MWKSSVLILLTILIARNTGPMLVTEVHFRMDNGEKQAWLPGIARMFLLETLIYMEWHSRGSMQDVLRIGLFRIVKSSRILLLVGKGIGEEEQARGVEQEREVGGVGTGRDACATRFCRGDWDGRFGPPPASKTWPPPPQARGREVVLGAVQGFRRTFTPGY